MQIPSPIQQALDHGLPDLLAIGIVKDAAGKHNPITLSWIMQTSRMPPMLAISVAPSRHSFDALRLSKQFVIAYPAVGQEGETVLYGTASGRNMDKLVRGGTRIVPASKIDSVLMTDALANFECELAGEFVTGDHSIFVGRIVAAHVNNDRNVRRIYAFGYVDYASVERGGGG